MEKLVVVGQGYVGLPLAMRAVGAGFHVVGLETDEHRVKQLAAGESPIEDVTDDDLRAAMGGGRYVPSSEARSAAGFDVAVISVPTPLRDGAPDLSFVAGAATTLARYLRPHATVVLESTTYPGTTEEMVGPILEEGSGLSAGTDFHLGYSPERTDPGNRTWTLTTTPKVVAGVDEASLAAIKGFYDRIVEETVVVSGTREAELCKLIENTFRHVNVALMNELAMFAADLDIDIWEAIDAASTKPFGYLRFTPGPGVGGHCLPIDPSYLSWRVRQRLGHSFRFVELANDVNDHMPGYVVKRVVTALNRRRQAANGSRILLLGLSYKANTGDVRESPSVGVAGQLIGLGAEVRGVDPFVDETAQIVPGLIRADLTPEELASADAVVLLVDHAAFDLGAVTTHASYVLDTRHVLEGAHVEYL